MSYFIDLTGADERPPYDHLLPPARADDERYVIYVRKPLPDRGVAPRPEAIAEILDYVALAIEVGHCVYLHCAAGIGRANLIAGCWLRRAGQDAGAALERLNLLWRANPRAGSVPRVPPAEPQRRCVETWAEPPARADAEPDWPLDLGAIGRLRGRYLGSLVGLACGDAMGASVQFLKVGQFTPVASLVGGGRWQLPPGAWTDDTAISLCLAESLAALETFDPADLRQRLRRWRQDGQPTSTGQCVGITAAVAAALDDGAAALPPERGAAAGGALAVTRAGVVAMFAASHPERALAWSVAAAAVTDRSIVGRNAAMVYAALMLAALRGADRADLVAAARELWSGFARAPVGIFDVALGLAGRRARADHAVEEPADPFAVLRIVVAAVNGSDGLRDGLVGLVNRGGDADLHGALFGQLAGALYGVDAIPPAWRAALLRRALLEDCADRLLAAALAPRE